MKINKPTKDRSTRKIVLIILIIALALVGVVAYYFFIMRPAEKSNQTDTNRVDYSAPTNEQKQAGEDAEEHAEEQKKSTTPVNTPPPNTDSAVSSGKQPTSVTISSIEQDNAGTLRVRTIIQAIEDTPGTCKIAVTSASGATVFADSASSQRQGSYSTCMGFDIPKAKLGTTGQVTATVTYTSTYFEGKATSQVTIK